MISPLLSSSQPLLFHGTRYPAAILTSDRLRLPRTGYPMVSLTRDIRVARHWATLSRDDDEGQGAILVLDRNKLRQRYRIELFRDVTCFGEKPRTFGSDEAEEMIWLKPIKSLSRFLLDVQHVGPEPVAKLAA